MNLRPCICTHDAADHQRLTLGRGRCGARLGAFSDPPTIGELCECRAYQAGPREAST